MSSRKPVRIPDRPPDPRRDRKCVAPIPPPFDRVMERFNAGEYRACVEPLEELFFADRNTFLQGLLHLVVALLQIRLGMVRGPRIRLASAAELLSPYTPWHRGVDVEALLRAIEACSQRLPEDVVQLPTEEMERLTLPMPQLQLSPRREQGGGKSRMPASEKIRCAVIGAGGFAEICHVPGLQSHPAAEVVILCGRNEQKREAMAARLGVQETVGDYHEVIARPDIDAVTITTPNVSHATITIAALEAGKHVFCEKPLAMEAREAEAMLRAAQERGLIHQVAFTFRYTHSVAQLRQRLREGVIGRPFFVRMVGEGWGDLRPEARVRWRHQKELSGAGMLADMGSHYFDLVNWVLAPVAEVCGMLLTVERQRPGPDGQPTRVDSDDLAHVWFRTTDGLAGEFRSSRVTPSHGQSGFMEVVGEEGSLMASLTRGDQDSLRLLRPTGGSEEIPLPEESRSGQPYALGRMMRSFIDSIRRAHSDPDQDPGFEAGLAAQRAQDAVLRSVETKAWQRLQE